MEVFEIETHENCEALDITHKVEEIVQKSHVISGICTLFIPHTTAAITINENRDPSVMKDIINTLNNLIPVSGKYIHLEGNSHAHIRAAIIGSSRDIFIENGRMVLGTWQGIFFLEFDGPRKRRVFVKIIENS